MIGINLDFLQIASSHVPPAAHTPVDRYVPPPSPEHYYQPLSSSSGTINPRVQHSSVPTSNTINRPASSVSLQYLQQQQQYASRYQTTARYPQNGQQQYQQRRNSRLQCCSATPSQQTGCVSPHSAVDYCAAGGSRDMYQTINRYHTMPSGGYVARGYVAQDADYRDYSNSRDYLNGSRDYLGGSRDYLSSTSGSRDYLGRDYGRDYGNCTREYAPNREYVPTSTSNRDYVSCNRDYVEYGRLVSPVPQPQQQQQQDTMQGDGQQMQCCRRQSAVTW